MKLNKLFRRPWHWLLWITEFLILVEGSECALSAVDFPLYEANAQIGYIPTANQHGSFLNKINWQFNALHMGGSAFAPNPSHDVLLVGDGLVYGGNGYRQLERLGPALQARITESGGGGAGLAPFSRQLVAA